MRARRIGINTYQEPVIYMHAACHVCKSEGFEAHSRIEVAHGARRVIATLNIVTSEILAADEAGLSEAAWHALGLAAGDVVSLAHPRPLESFSMVRAKIYGRTIPQEGFAAIVRDVVDGNYSDIEIASFITACTGRLDVDEVIALTRAMIDVGERLRWNHERVLDKHCIGGLPGNRTTLLVVPIVAACGLVIPKTSSRAITSPAGTADTMETLAPVALDIAAIRRVVDGEGGCVVWGGAVSLSPADDVLIRVERPMDLDSDAQLVASVLSKKIAAGSTHVMIDIPVGPTAKMRRIDAAHALGDLLARVGTALGIRVRSVITDGSQPVGRGIGPALEAWDVLAVLQNQADAPADLRQRGLDLAAGILEMGGKAARGHGMALARQTLESGAAWAKFQAICQAQGGLREPPRASHQHVIRAPHDGRVVAVDNRRLARVAKLAGAPQAKAAGVLYHVPLGSVVVRDQPLYTIHAQSPGELAYARSYADAQDGVVTVRDGVDGA